MKIQITILLKPTLLERIENHKQKQKQQGIKTDRTKTIEKALEEYLNKEEAKPQITGGE